MEVVQGMLMTLCSQTKQKPFQIDSSFCSEKRPSLVWCNQLPISTPVGMNFLVIHVRTFKMSQSNFYYQPSFPHFPGNSMIKRTVWTLSYVKESKFKVLLVTGCFNLSFHGERWFFKKNSEFSFGI